MLRPIRRLSRARALPWFCFAVAATFAVLQAMPTFASPQDEAAGQDEMMKKWNEYVQTGPEHRQLAEFEGTWNFEITQYMPGMEPIKSKGQAVHSMTMGGRFLKDETTSKVMGQPFHGLGHTGYDNALKKYVFTWLDNMGTGIMAGLGDYDEKTKTYTYQVHSSDPMTGKTKHGRTTIQWTSETTHTMKAFERGPEGSESLSMQIDYRKVAPTSKGR